MKTLPIFAFLFLSDGLLRAQSPNDSASSSPSPSIPAGPRPIAAISQVTTMP